MFVEKEFENLDEDQKFIYDYINGDKYERSRVPMFLYQYFSYLEAIVLLELFYRDMVKPDDDPIEFPVKNLSLYFGCNRTTLHRALTKLESKGLISIESYIGYPLEISVNSAAFAKFLRDADECLDDVFLNKEEK